MKSNTFSCVYLSSVCPLQWNVFSYVLPNPWYGFLLVVCLFCSYFYRFLMCKLIDLRMFLFFNVCINVINFSVLLYLFPKFLYVAFSFSFRSVHFFFLFPLRLLPWPRYYLCVMFTLLSVEIFLLYFWYWFLVRFHFIFSENTLYMISMILIWLFFFLMFQQMVYLGMCVWGHSRLTCAQLLLGRVCYKCLLDLVGVQFFTCSDFHSSCSVNFLLNYFVFSSVNFCVKYFVVMCNHIRNVAISYYIMCLSVLGNFICSNVSFNWY